MGDRADDVMNVGVVVIFLVVLYLWANRNTRIRG